MGSVFAEVPKFVIGVERSDCHTKLSFQGDV
jgi:hypothetical protein